LLIEVESLFDPELVDYLRLYLNRENIEKDLSIKNGNNNLPKAEWKMPTKFKDQFSRFLDLNKQLIL
jgi:hypothetical protein